MYNILTAAELNAAGVPVFLAENYLAGKPYTLPRITPFFVRGGAWRQYVDHMDAADARLEEVIGDINARYAPTHSLLCRRQYGDERDRALYDLRTIRDDIVERSKDGLKTKYMLAFEEAIQKRGPVTQADFVMERDWFITLYEHIEGKIAIVSDFQTRADMADAFSNKHACACSFGHLAWNAPAFGLVGRMADPEKRTDRVVALAFGHLNMISDEHLVSRLGLPAYTGRGLIRAFPALYAEFLRARWPGFGTST